MPISREVVSNFRSVSAVQFERRLERFAGGHRMTVNSRRTHVGGRELPSDVGRVTETAPRRRMWIARSPMMRAAMRLRELNEEERAIRARFPELR